MRTLLMIPVAMLAASVSADEILIGRGGSSTVNVPSGDPVVQTDRVSVQDGATFYKTGEGEFRLSNAAVLQNNPLDLKVRQGSVTVDFAGAAPDETADDAAAVEIMNRAAFWVRADVAAGLVVTNEKYVVQWRDVREGAVTDPAAAHQYAYALPKWDASLSAKPLYGKPPCLASHKGQSAVYFGGFKSSQKMWWYKADGSELKLTNIRNAFIVQGVSNSYGYAVMSRSNGSADFHVGNTGGDVAGPIWVAFAGDGKAMRDASQTFLNGNYVDGAVAQPPRSANFLLDVRFLGLDASAGAFFTDRDINDRTGGDYLSEALVFTNRLTAVECERVSRYLLKRYGLAQKPVLALATAAGATASFSVPEGTTLAGGFSFSGVGSITKGGTGTIRFPWQDGLSFDGDFRLLDGIAYLNSPYKFRVLGGEDVTVSANNAIAEPLTMTGGTPDEFGKKGSGALRIDGVPETVTKIRVEAGELALTSPFSEQGLGKQPLVPGQGRSGTFANGDFTVMTNSYPTTGQLDILTSSGTSGSCLDWTGLNNSDWQYTPQVFFVNYDQFNGGTAGKWPSGGVAPPKSRCFLAVKGDATAWSTFTVPAAGEYVLSFFAQGRYNLANAHHSPIAVKIGPDADHLTTLGVILSAQEDNWQPYEYETGRLEPGSYQIWLVTETTGKDNCTAFADFALTQLAEHDGTVAYKIPNGDFETLAAGVRTTSFTTDLRLEGWTFEQGTYFDSYPSAAHPGIGACFNGVTLYNTVLARPAIYGANRSRLAFAENKGSHAETTFTPPPGTYRLRGELMRYSGHWSTYNKADGTTTYCSPRNSPVVEATVTIGGAAQSLGTVTTAHFDPVQVTWNRSFTVDGTQAVTLRLANTASSSAGTLDNLVLVSASSGVELIADGNFETGGSSWEWIDNKDASVTGLSYSKAERLTISSDFNRNNWSTDPSAGNYCARICQRGQIRQSVTFPAAGLYRLSFRAHSRPDGPNGGYGSGQNPIHVYLTQSGSTATNEIGWAFVGSTNFVEHVMNFHVPAAATYNLNLQGLCDGTEGHLWPSGRDQSTLVESVSVKGIEGDVEDCTSIPESVSVSVAKNARLRLDYPGTNKVEAVRLNGVRVTGLINAETHPEYIQGPGALFVERHGCVLIFR